MRRSRAGKEYFLRVSPSWRCDGGGVATSSSYCHHSLLAASFWQVQMMGLGHSHVESGSVRERADGIKSENNRPCGWRRGIVGKKALEGIGKPLPSLLLFGECLSGDAEKRLANRLARLGDSRLAPVLLPLQSTDPRQLRSIIPA